MSCQCVMCCDAAWTPTWLTEQQMDWAQWLVMEVAPLKATAALFSLCVAILVCLRNRGVLRFLSTERDWQKKSFHVCSSFFKGT